MTVEEGRREDKSCSKPCSTNHPEAQVTHLACASPLGEVPVLRIITVAVVYTSALARLYLFYVHFGNVIERIVSTCMSIAVASVAC